MWSPLSFVFFFANPLHTYILPSFSLVARYMRRDLGIYGRSTPANATVGDFKYPGYVVGVHHYYIHVSYPRPQPTYMGRTRKIASSTPGRTKGEAKQCSVV